MWAQAHWLAPSRRGLVGVLTGDARWSMLYPCRVPDLDPPRIPQRPERAVPDLPEESTVTTPRVSVIIPTRGRPDRVAQAVDSALAQTRHDIEVIVVVDGPDPATELALSAIADQRLRVEVLPQHAGIAGARNRGVALASAPWVAFLDDDDEWHPDKLARQVQAAEDSQYPFPIIATRFLARFGTREYLWPRRPPRPDERLDEYLFCRNGLFSGERTVLPSTLLASRELLTRYPFSTQVQRCEDVDWLLRVTSQTGARVEYIWGQEPLAIWNQQPADNRPIPRKSRISWHDMMLWLDGIRPLLSPRGYSSAVLTWLAPSAATLGETDAFGPFLRAAFRYGRPTPLDVLLYLVAWITPRAATAPFSERYDRWKRRRAATNGPPSPGSRT